MRRHLAEKPGKGRGKGQRAGKQDPNIQRLEMDLSERLGNAVKINHGRSGKGSLVINYGSLDELDGILSRIK